jgi:UDP:flavonoid glycosyltransferase YjiC (YdhE family)
MIPLARKLREMNNNIIIGSGEEHLSLFRKELPGLEFISFPGFKPGYSRLLPQYLYLVLNIPLLLYHIIVEHYRLRRIIREHAIDMVISDNRFGLWNRKITSVYITHMPLIPFPWPLRFMEPVGVLLHGIIIKKYSLCFIPDLPGDLNLSGRLSHDIKLPDNIRYIGILSRFDFSDQPVSEKPVEFPHNTVILSGPEPQKEILKKKLTALLKEVEPMTVMLEGKPGTGDRIFKNGNIIFYNHLSAPQMKNIITGSNYIISRSGYTTIMELVSLNCTALLIPTPGQTEQEYLAEYLSEKGWFYTVSQLDLKAGIPIISDKPGRPGGMVTQSSILLNKALEELLEKHHSKG